MIHFIDILLLLIFGVLLLGMSALAIVARDHPVSSIAFSLIAFVCWAVMFFYIKELR